MFANFRHFEVADPFGQTWQAAFLWQQNAISIRHADAVDVKFRLTAADSQMEKVVALLHPLLLRISARTARPITDPWCSRLAALHVRHMIETWEDMEKALVAPSFEDLERYDTMLEQDAAAVRR